MTPRSEQGLPWRAAMVGLVAALVFSLSLGLVLDLSLARAAMRVQTLHTVFTWDVPALLLMVLGVAVALAIPSERLASLWDTLTTGKASVAGWALSAGIGALWCWWLVGHHALVTDEYVHLTGSGWWGHARPFELPAAYAGLADVIYPLHFRYDALGNQVVSSYLPAHEATLALASSAGLIGLANAGWTALAVVLAALLAAKVFPEHAEAPGAAALLTATSMQLLWLGGSYFSMPMHLAVGVLWVLLAVDDRPWTAPLAGTLSIVATGIHQWVVHPAMAAPILVYLVGSRRVGRAGVLFVAVVGALLFWAPYHGRLLGTDAGGAGLVTEIVNAFWFYHSAFDVVIYPAQAVAWLSWQHFAWLPLMLASVLVRRQSPWLLVACVCAALMAIAPSAVLFPSPGRGWGYRYAHVGIVFLNLWAVQGLLLVATRADRGRLALLTIASCFVGMGMRSAQAPQVASLQVGPAGWVRSQTAEVLLVDDPSFILGTATVRNTVNLDPPVVLSGAALSDAQLDLVCERFGKVRVVDIEDVRAAGAVASPFAEPSLKATLATRDCLAL